MTFWQVVAAVGVGNLITYIAVGILYMVGTMGRG